MIAIEIIRSKARLFNFDIFLLFFIYYFPSYHSLNSIHFLPLLFFIIFSHQFPSIFFFFNYLEHYLSHKYLHNKNISNIFNIFFFFSDYCSAQKFFIEFSSLTALLLFSLFYFLRKCMFSCIKLHTKFYFYFYLFLLILTQQQQHQKEEKKTHGKAANTRLASTTDHSTLRDE